MLVSRRSLLVGGLALLSAGLAAGYWLARAQAPAVPPPPPVPAAPRPVPPRLDLGEGEQRTIKLFEQASPSVVYITSIALQQQFFSRNVFQVPVGTGSGFVWDDRGHLITNFHVIQNADRARVTLADRSTWDATLVGVSPEKDLAVLKIDAPLSALKPIPVGVSRELRVGQTVLAIGNPFGLDQTLTTGVISALGREIESVARVPIRDVIQTDAAINPGNSGGPLLDSAGRLIGVNTQIYSPTGASAGIGFAIPVDELSWVVPELIAHGRVRRPALGLEFAAPQWTRRLGLGEGVLVLEVSPGGPGALAGLRGTSRNRRGEIELGDVIVEIDGQTVNSSAEIMLALERKQAGETVRITIVRNGRQQELTITLAAAR